MYLASAPQTQVSAGPDNSEIIITLKHLHCALQFNKFAPTASPCGVSLLTHKLKVLDEAASQTKQP